MSGFFRAIRQMLAAHLLAAAMRADSDFVWGVLLVSTVQSMRRNDLASSMAKFAASTDAINPGHAEAFCAGVNATADVLEEIALKPLSKGVSDALTRIHRSTTVMDAAA